MTYTVEVLLRETARVISKTVSRDERSASEWTEAEVASVLEGMLGAIARAKEPEVRAPIVALRGLSWIVDPVAAGVVIAIEIPSGAVVAGPFTIEQERLSALIGRSISGAGSSPEAVGHREEGRVH